MIVSRFRGETINGVWCGELMYCPLTHTTQNYNYSAVANLYSLQNTSAPTKPFFQPAVFISRSLATASYGRNSSVFHDQFLSLQPLGQNSTELTARLAAISHRPPSLLFKG
jgi:hypothetical protein